MLRFVKASQTNFCVIIRKTVISGIEISSLNDVVFSFYPTAALIADLTFQFKFAYEDVNKALIDRGTWKSILMLYFWEMFIILRNILPQLLK